MIYITYFRRMRLRIISKKNNSNVFRIQLTHTPLISGRESRNKQDWNYNDSFSSTPISSLSLNSLWQNLRRVMRVQHLFYVLCVISQLDWEVSNDDCVQSVIYTVCFWLYRFLLLSYLSGYFTITLKYCLELHITAQSYKS